MTDIRYFMDHIQLPKEAQDELIQQMEHLISCHPSNPLKIIAEDFFQNRTREYYLASLEQVSRLADSLQISTYTMDFLYLMHCGELLQSEYQTEGLSENLFWDTMSDLRCKLYECWNCHRIWGTFVAKWYYIFWNKTLFKLGRLEYQRIDFPYEVYQKGELLLTKGDPVYTIHIPSEGPLHTDDVLVSLQQAHHFFRFKEGEAAPFVCHSWLLYPGNAEIFPPHSNLMKFFQLFDLIDYFASAIIPGSRVSFRIFVGANGTEGFKHLLGYIVFRCNKFDAGSLPFFFLLDEIENL